MFQDKFQEIKTKLVHPSIKVIEWYVNQDKKKGEITIAPTIHIEFSDANINRLTKHTEEVTIPFTVIIYTDFLKDTSKIGDATTQHFGIEQTVIDKLNKYEKTGWSPVEKLPSGILKSAIEYNMHFTQSTSYSQNFQISNTPVQPIIGVSLE